MYFEANILLLYCIMSFVPELSINFTMSCDIMFYLSFKFFQKKKRKKKRKEIIKRKEKLK